MTDEELNNIRVIVRDEVTSSEERVLGEIGKFMEDQLFPELEEKADKSDIERIERKIDNISVQVVEHGQDLQKIKAIPAIAHEIRSK